MDLWLNKTVQHGSRLPARLACRVGDAAATEPLRLLRLCPAFRTTPLISLPEHAEALNVASVHWKDESQRLGLKSFKALGGAYAVFALMEQRLVDRLGRSPNSDDWTGPVLPELAADLTLAAATAGNHGLAVLAGARIIGARCVIFVHDKVPEERRARLIAAGAELRVCTGDYEDSLEVAKTTAAAHEMVLIPDTADDVDDAVSGRVVQGYSVLSREIIDQLAAAGNKPPTHVFVQAGVGGLAASTAGVLSDYYGAERPTIIVVEPDRARAIITSLRAGHCMRTPESRSTRMDMLACYAPSALAYDVLRRLADGSMTISDAQAEEAVRSLGVARGTQPILTTTPSGAAGLAGLTALRSDPEACSALNLDSRSRIILIGSESGQSD